MQPIGNRFSGCLSKKAILEKLHLVLNDCNTFAHLGIKVADPPSSPPISIVLLLPTTLMPTFPLSHYSSASPSSSELIGTPPEVDGSESSIAEERRERDTSSDPIDDRFVGLVVVLVVLAVLIGPIGLLAAANASTGREGQTDKKLAILLVLQRGLAAATSEGAATSAILSHGGE